MARANRSIVNSKPNSFNSTWKTDNTSAGSSTANQIALPLSVSGSYNFTVYWGDGTNNTITSSLQPEITHSYSLAGTYNVTMSGYIRGWSFNGTRDRRKIIDISQWGGIKISAQGSQFFGCTDLTLNNISDTPNLYSKNLNPTFSSSIAAMFRSCSLLVSISRLDQWDTSQVQFMGVSFFNNNRFNQNIGSWNTSRVTNMDNMFAMPAGLSGVFDNGGSNSINNWDTGNVITMASMFQNQPSFNRNIGNWNVSKVANFSFMFGLGAGTGLFNNGNSDSIKNWNMSSSTTIRTMFQRQINFNQEIGTWNVSNVTDMGFLLAGNIDKAFNNAGSPSIGTWNTSKVTNMTGMFIGCNLFNQNVGAWDTSNVLTMDGLFFCSGTPGIFNNSGSSTINNWNTSKVTNMSGLFRNQALFNQPVNSWDTSRVVDMSNVFLSATGFNQSLSNWNVSSSTTVANFMFGKTFNDYSTANYDALLIGWASRPVRPNLSTNFGTIRYTAAAAASRAVLTSAPNNWTIVDGGQI